MSEIRVEFRFELGELVYVRGASHNAGAVPRKFVIYERFAQQCHGGIQRMYKLFGVDGLVPETVIAREKPEYEPQDPAYFAEEIAAEEARYAEQMKRYEAKRKARTDATDA